MVYRTKLMQALVLSAICLALSSVVARDSRAAAMSLSKEFLIAWTRGDPRISVYPLNDDGTPSAVASSRLNVPGFESLVTPTSGSLIIVSSIDTHGQYLQAVRISEDGVLSFARPATKCECALADAAWTPDGSVVVGTDVFGNTLSSVRVSPSGDLKVMTSITPPFIRPKSLVLDEASRLVYVLYKDSQLSGLGDFISSYKIGRDGALTLRRSHESKHNVYVQYCGDPGNIVLVRHPKRIAGQGVSGIVLASFGKNGSLSVGHGKPVTIPNGTDHTAYRLYAPKSGTYFAQIDSTHRGIKTFCLLAHRNKDAVSSYNALVDPNVVPDTGEEGIAGPQFATCAFSTGSDNAYLLDVGNMQIVTLRINRYGIVQPGMSRVTPLTVRAYNMNVMGYASSPADKLMAQDGTVYSAPVMPIRIVPNSTEHLSDTTAGSVPDARLGPDNGPTAKAVPGSASRDFLYIINNAPDINNPIGGLSMYQAGRLPTALSPPLFVFPGEIDSAVQDPSGRCLYGIEETALCSFSISDTGQLKGLADGGPPIAMHGNDEGYIEDVLVSPSGNAVYAAIHDGFIAQFRRTSDGHLTVLHPDGVHAPNLCFAIAISPNGKRLFALGRPPDGSPDVDPNSAYSLYQYIVRDNGTLKREKVLEEEIPNASGIVADPLGRYLFVSTERGIVTIPIGPDGDLFSHNKKPVHIAAQPQNGLRQFEHVRNFVVDPTGGVGYAIEQADDETRSVLTHYTIEANGAVVPVKNWFLGAKGSLVDGATASDRTKEEFLWLTLDPVNHMLYANESGPAGSAENPEEMTHRLVTGFYESPEHRLFGYRLEQDNTLLRPDFWQCTTVKSPGYAIYVHRPAQVSSAAK